MHPSDSQANLIFIGDTIVWSRNQQSVGTGTVARIYQGRWGNSIRVGVKTKNGIVTLQKPERALVVRRAEKQ